ncbi:M12 family metallo-peptidase [Massilia sp. METH4]|uniref:M12 family metallo-peptidase n=1 Tax=Massilia sp. METH4 TaxID=3123041 RepID=UPI0030CC2989
MRIKPSTPPHHGGNQQQRIVPGARSSLFLSIALAFTAAAPIALAAQAANPAVSIQRAAPHWQSAATPADSLAVGRSDRKVALKLKRFHAATLDKPGMQALTAGAPQERGIDDIPDTLTISLPHPDGGYQRFALVEAPIMEPGLAARHPDIKTYRGKGIDDPTATLRMDITKLGLHASVRSPNGGWYVDPYYHLDDSLYASYHSRDLVNQHGPLVEAALGGAQLTLSRGFYKEGENVEVRGLNFTPGATVNVTVRAEGEDGGVQTVAATADSNGVLALTLPAGGKGAFEVTASDGRATTTAAYHVVDASAAAGAVTGNQLRTYRLALVTDPSYASYFGGSANVTAAKVTLVNRVTQIYEDETSIRLVLVDGNDALNLDTDAQMTGANGPCGATACYTVEQASGCDSPTLSRNRVVTGLLVGASNFDIGHIAFGLNGGGIASLGVVGSSGKAQGCTGVPTPIGDYFAVDYVAHEIGHQFAGNHTFNGVNWNCSGGNRNPETSVEPGSGTSIMAYAGICREDNVQPHSDPYWSQRSFDEITSYVTSGESELNELQAAVLRNFTSNGRQFRISWNGNLSAPIVRGTNYTAAAIKQAIQNIAGWPRGGTVNISALSDAGFNITFGGTLARTNVGQLQLVNFSSGVTGYVGEIVAGGLTTRGGNISGTGNSAPLVTAPAGYTIPVRTPFALTGSATDGEGDTVTYLWEQNDRGGADGTALFDNVKKNGPLFSQFGKRAVVTSEDTIKYNSPGENHVTTNPTRVFPDLDQILANNTNAETGACPTPAATPTAANIECYAEFLPTAAYVGLPGTNANPASLNFRLTARDGRGGVSSADTRLVLARDAGPFLVTSPNAAVTLEAGSLQTVTWSVANTNAAPVGVENVKISLSTDGGKTWPHVLAASTANDGSAPVTLPSLATTKGRVKVEALGNVFFDVSNANFTINLTGDINADGSVDCADMGIITAAFGKRSSQNGFDARADTVRDGIINVRDLNYVAVRVPQGTSCN